MQIDVASVERGLADLLQRALDARVRGVAAAVRGVEGAQRGELVRVGTGEVLLLEQVSLDLAAGRLGDAAHRHHRADLESGVFTDAARDRVRHRRERRDLAPVQHEYDQRVRVGAGRPHARDHDLAEFQTRQVKVAPRGRAGSSSGR